MRIPVRLTILWTAGVLAYGQSHGYAYVGGDSIPGGTFNAVSVGGGFNARVWKGLGIASDLAFLSPTRDPSEGIGLLSIGPSWTFLAKSRVQPFAAGGWALGFREGAEKFAWYGGGVVYWFASRVGLRAELRNYHFQGERFDTSLRVGVTFR